MSNTVCILYNGGDVYVSYILSFHIALEGTWKTLIGVLLDTYVSRTKIFLWSNETNKQKINTAYIYSLKPPVFCKVFEGILA